MSFSQAYPSKMNDIIMTYLAISNFKLEPNLNECQNNFIFNRKAYFNYNYIIK